jgi:hypothetical protein
MLRLVLLVLYLLASFSASDSGGGYDPNGASLSPPASDAGSGYDPNG